MIYFSELKGKKIVTEDQLEVGYLDDLIFQATESPKVTKLLVVNKTKDKLIISADHIKKINDVVIIEKAYHTGQLVENELYILKNLLDKQIIDLVGNKIVRVNDIVFQQNKLEKFELFVVGVDIGILGVLRWMKLEDLIIKLLHAFKINSSSKFLSWSEIAPLELARGKVRMKKKEEKLGRIRPEDLADYLEKTNVSNTRKLLKTLDKDKAAEVIGDLNINYQAHLFKSYKPERAAEIVAVISPDDAVDVLLTLSERRRQLIIDQLPDKKKREINHLLNLSSTEIGALATTEFFTVFPTDQVDEVLIKIKEKTEDFSFLNPIYVVNKEEQLIGVFNLHELLLKEPKTQVYKFMIQNVVVIHLTTPMNIALNKLSKYKLSALPVIDDNKRILGIVTVVDLFRLARIKG